MRRAVARGRVFPQYFSTDRRYGRLSLKACALFPLMWVNADDQGRLPGDSEEIKYAACPNIDHITKADIPNLLEELGQNQLIAVYDTSKTKAIQMLDWWEVQKLQWAWPSQYSAPDGWVDHLRYKKSAKEVITRNWPVSGESQNGSQVKNQVTTDIPSGEELGREIRSELMPLPDTVDRLAEHEAIKDKLAKLGERKGLVAKSEVNTEVGRIDLLWEEPTGEAIAAFEIDVYSPREKSLAKLRGLGCPYSFVILRSNPEPLQWEQDILLIGLAKERERTKEKEIEKRRGKRRGRGKSPEPSGEQPSSSSVAYCSDFNSIFDELLKNFRTQWGRVPKEKAAGASPVKDSDIIPREPTPREVAQIRDLARALAAAGGCPLDYLREVFREAAAHGKEKENISYLKAILANWLDRPELRAKQRAPP